MLDIIAAKSNRLIHQSESITKCSVSFFGNDVERLFININAFIVCHLFEMTDNFFYANTLKIKTLYTRQNSRKYFMRLGSRKNKNDVIGRLFKRFQQRVKR